MIKCKLCIQEKEKILLFTGIKDRFETITRTLNSSRTRVTINWNYTRFADLLSLPTLILWFCDWLHKASYQASKFWLWTTKRRMEGLRSCYIVQFFLQLVSQHHCPRQFAQNITQWCNRTLQRLKSCRDKLQKPLRKLKLGSTFCNDSNQLSVSLLKCDTTSATCHSSCTKNCRV